MSFNQRIKEIRGNKTMLEFSKQIDTKVASISAWENNGALPSVPKLIQLSECLNLSTDYLLGLSDDAVYIPKSNTNLSVNAKDIMKKVQNIQGNPTGIIKYANDSIVYSTQPMNSLIINDDSKTLSSNYINLMIHLIINSNTHKNIVINSDVILSSSLITDIFESGYSVLQFTNNLNNNTTSSSFNILQTICSMPDDVIMNVMLTLSKQFYDEAISSKLTAFYLFYAFKDYIKSHENNELSFDSFYKFNSKSHIISDIIKNPNKYPKLKQNIELDSNKTAIYNLASLANMLLNMLSKSDYITFLDKAAPLTFDKPFVMNIHQTDNDNIVIKAALSSIGYIIEEKAKTTKTPMFLVKKAKDLVIESMVTGIALNQETCIIADSSLSSMNTNVMLANVDLIVNGNPLSDDISQIISKRFDPEYYALPYSIGSSGSALFQTKPLDKIMPNDGVLTNSSQLLTDDDSTKILAKSKYKKQMKSIPFGFDLRNKDN